MPQQTASGWRSTDRVGLVRKSRRLLVAILLLMASRASAQSVMTGVEPQRFYTNKTSIRLPIVIDSKSRSQVREVRIYLKRSSEKAWKLQDRAAPSQPYFTCNVLEDNEYCFTEVAVTQAGKEEAVDAAAKNLSWTVVVDTRAPHVEIRRLVSSSEDIFFQTVIFDANPDSSRTRVEYQLGNGTWINAMPVPGQSDTYSIPHEAITTGCVRVTATDRAGNVGKCEQCIRLSAMNTPKPEPSALVIPAESPTFTFKANPPLIPVDKVELHPIPPVVQTTSAPVADSSKARPTEKPDTEVRQVSARLPETPVAPPVKTVEPESPMPEPQKVVRPPASTNTPPAAGTEKDDKSNFALVQLVNDRNVTLEYQVEQASPDGTGPVEVWYTRDRGKTWTFLVEDLNCRNKIAVKLPEDGLFGMKLVLGNDSGTGRKAPNPGEIPDWWIEVHTPQATAKAPQPKIRIVGAAAGKPQ